MSLRPSFIVVVVMLLAGCPLPGGTDGIAPPREGEGEGNEGEGEEVGEGEGEGADVSARFVAVGYGGRRLTSTDGRAWDNDVEDVAGGGDDDQLLRGACTGVVDGVTVVLAVGGSAAGRVLRSVDGGLSWTAIVDDDGWIGACAFSGHEFVFVGSARSARSVDGGLSLVDRGVHFEKGGNWEMRDVAFVAQPDGDGQFIAVGDLGVSTSSDGVAWTAPAGPQNLFRLTSSADGETVVVVGPSLRASSPSTNLVDWNEQAGSGFGDVGFARALNGGQGLFLVVGEGFGETSPDGVTWTRQAQPAMARLVVGVVDGVETVVGANYADVRRLSTDGVTWQDVANDGGNAIDDLVFVPGR